MLFFKVILQTCPLFEFAFGIHKIYFTSWKDLMLPNFCSRKVEKEETDFVQKLARRGKDAQLKRFHLLNSLFKYFTYNLICPLNSAAILFLSRLFPASWRFFPLFALLGSKQSQASGDWTKLFTWIYKKGSNTCCGSLRRLKIL